MRDTAHDYSAVAIVLHWAIAAAIVGNIAIGWWMHQAIEAPDTQARAIAAFQLHKSIGLTVLVLSLLRLAWRLLHPPPPLPAGMPIWERVAAKATHWLFYGLMIAIPMSGWLYVSTQWREDAPLNIPTLWFGLFEVPHLFGLDTAALELRRRMAGIAFETHELLAWGTAWLLALHVAAALKHHFVDRDAVLRQMLPALQANTGEPRRDRSRRIILRGGSAAIVVAAAAVVAALLKPPGPAPADYAGTLSAQSGRTAITAAPESWNIDPARSQINFSGVHAGDPFQGRFTRWRIDARIDADRVGQSRIEATIYTASATDGVPLHDKTLPQDEWFDVDVYPVAEFRSTDIRQVKESRYAVGGILTIKGNEIRIPPLSLNVEGDTATIAGSFEIDRAEADLGMESDPKGRWVSREIGVEVRAKLTRSAADGGSAS